jgi:hypothetical protein
MKVTLEAFYKSLPTIRLVRELEQAKLDHDFGHPWGKDEIVKLLERVMDERRRSYSG